MACNSPGTVQNNISATRHKAVSQHNRCGDPSFWTSLMNTLKSNLLHSPLKNLMMSVKSMLFSRMMSLYISTSARAMKRTKFPEEVCLAAQIVSHTENTSSYTISGERQVGGKCPGKKKTYTFSYAISVLHVRDASHI